MDASILKSVPYLATLSDEEIAGLLPLAASLTAEPTKRIIEEDQPVDSIYFVIKGVVHVRSKSGDREVLLARIGEGGCFGEINLFIGENATASVYAMDKCELARIPYTKFRQFLDANPATGYRILSLVVTELSRRLRNTSERLANSVYWGH